MKEERYQRLRLLVRKLNNIRRKQRQKIDILCNDIIASHKTFVEYLRSFQFAADFYESILGSTTLDALAAAAGEFITENIADSNVIIAFKNSEHPQLYLYSKDPQLEDIAGYLSPSITMKMVESVCYSSKVCTADDLCKMGFFASPAVLKKITIAAIGLTNTGPATGMILLYRTVDKPFKKMELLAVSSIVKGLSKAAKSLQSADRCDSIA